MLLYNELQFFCRIPLLVALIVFYRFTGLAYIDVCNLKQHNIVTINGERWIQTRRQKTDTLVEVPLLKIPEVIIEKYKGRVPGDSLIPISTNQKVNAYLKEIADLCGIQKNLSYHLGRHTFATTITLSKGVSMESVSKMLGHTKITTTQIYARILNSKVKEEMKLVEKALEDAV